MYNQALIKENDFLIIKNYLNNMNFVPILEIKHSYKNQSLLTILVKESIVFIKDIIEIREYLSHINTLLDIEWCNLNRDLIFINIKYREV